MRYVFALVASAFCVAACDGTVAVSPDAVRVSGPTASGSAPAPVDTSGVSCPSHAPTLKVGSLALRMDIDFSEIPGAKAYEIQIDRYTERNVFEPFAHLEVPAPAKYAAWYGITGRYLVKIRTINCGGFGNWSDGVSHAMDDGAAPGTPAPAPAPAPAPQPPAPKNPKKPHCTGKC